MKKDKFKKVKINSRVSLIPLATCAKYLSTINVPPRNKSELIDLCVFTLFRLVLNSGKIQAFETNHDALGYLDSLGIEWQKGSDGFRETITALQADEIAHRIKDEVELKELQESYESKLRELEGRSKEKPVQSAGRADGVLERFPDSIRIAKEDDSE